jgi:hypothetical protein
VRFRLSEEPCDDEGGSLFNEDTLARGNLTIHNGN